MRQFCTVCTQIRLLNIEIYIIHTDASSRGDFGDFHNNIKGHFGHSTPGSTYGAPPAPVYGPPNYEPQRPLYGVPVHQIYSGPIYGSVATGAAREETWLDRIKMKLDLFTIGKILLKIILFKKFIKFMAIICLLFLLPKFQQMDETAGDVDESASRQFDVKRKFLWKIHHCFTMIYYKLLYLFLNIVRKPNKFPSGNMAVIFFRKFAQYYSYNYWLSKFNSNFQE